MSENNNEEQKPVLNLRNFVRETNAFDVDAEIAVMISGVPVTIPIKAVTNTVTKDYSRKFVLLHVDYQDVMAAWNFAKEEDKRDKSNDN